MPIGHLAEIEYNLIAVDDDIVKLAEKIVTNGILKQKNIDDCQHIAAAILSDCDIIVSWNFKHIVNVKTIRGIKAITTVEGYKDLLFYQPHYWTRRSEKWTKLKSLKSVPDSMWKTLGKAQKKS